jgi:hypothetical protein
MLCLSLAVDVPPQFNIEAKALTGASAWLETEVPSLRKFLRLELVGGGQIKR